MQVASHISHFLLEIEDFQFAETTVQFPMPPNASQAQNITDVTFIITIVDDENVEERECFTCTFDIASVPGRERRCSPENTTICIVDPGE